MAFYDLREFMETLKQKGLLRVIRPEVDPCLEISEIMDRLVKKGGPAVMFEKVKGYDMP
ncbi:MAG: menaquinone biosynthesis decarboxylase, partial [Deltaproteobacteria bacterium]